MKKYLIILILFTSLIPLFALMPPHFRSSTPGDGGIFYNNTIVLKGYSLKYLNYSKLSIVDLKTKRQLKYSKRLKCKWTGSGNKPGDKQMKCIMTLKLKKTVKGRYYRITYRNFKIVVRSGSD